MAADPKLLLTTQPEKPNHYTYLKEFRVEQCQSFLQHKCNQHRPFICFNWHFMNQRRRRPVRKRDGTFNYSADNYCAKYDETTGICPDGDECPFLHRTAGDTERRYHLRYYKTCMCVHDTDTRGYCVKNGHHCAFAHGLHDQRPPVFDIKEIEAAQATDGNGGGGGGGGCNVGGGNGGGHGPNGLNGNGMVGGNGGCGDGLLSNAPNALDKERNLMNEDPKWQDTNYVLANYKTEPCKRPPRLCRQGYACPQYHNSKDKRRSPRKFKYRSTPCPNVKHGEEWGEPANCESGDNCQYCHTRTEQQFHPEIYKSTKCNDVQQAGYCPRSVFCAFAHVEPYILTDELQSGMDGPSGSLALGDLLSSVMQLDSAGNNGNKKDRLYGNSDGLLLHNGSGESCESASTSSVGSNQSHSKAPGAQLQQNKLLMQQQQQHHLQHHQHHQHQQHQQQQQQHHQQQHHLFQQNSLNNNGGGASSNNGNNNGNNNNSSSGSIGNGLLNAVNASIAAAASQNGSGGLGGLGALNAFSDFSPDIGKQLLAIENDTLMGALEKEQRKRMCLSFGLIGGGGVGGGDSKLDDLAVGGMRRDVFGQHHHQQQQQHQHHQLDTASISAGLASSGLLGHGGPATQPVNIPGNSQLTDSLTGFLQGNSAPVNIPDHFSPSLFGNHFGGGGGGGILGGSAPKMHYNSFGGLGGGGGVGAVGNGSLSQQTDNGGGGGGGGNSSSLFFQHHHPGLSDGLTISPDLGFNSHTLSGLGDMHRMRDELANQSALKINWEDRMLQASKACEAWRSEANESNRKAVIAEQQRDNALSHVQLVTEKLDLVSNGGGGVGVAAGNNGVGVVGGGAGSAIPRDLRSLSIQNLKGLQAKLRSDLEEVEKVLYLETATKCMKCEENNRSVTLVPCNHYVLCEQCAKSVRECPYCQTQVSSAQA